MGKKKGFTAEAGSSGGTDSQPEQQQQRNRPHSQPKKQQKTQHSQPQEQQQQRQRQQQQPSQASGAWQRGPPQQSKSQEVPHQPQLQQQQQQQQQQPSQASGAWQRGPPQQSKSQEVLHQPQLQQQQQQQPSQASGAWQRGPPQQSKSQEVLHQPQLQQQQQQQQPSQASGAWQRGPPQKSKSQEVPHQPQLQQQRQQQPSQASGAWQRGPPQKSKSQEGHQPEQRERPQEHTTSQKPEQQPQKSFPTQQRSKSGQHQQSKSPEAVEFAPRISATRKQGKIITVSTNFFPLKILQPNIVIHHYNVVIEPDKPRYLIRKVWNKFMSLVYPGRLTAFDGNKNAFSKGPLPSDGKITSVTVINPESNKEKEFKVSIEEVRTISFSCLENYREKALVSRSTKLLPEAEIAVLDVILNNWACDNFVRSGRTFFPLSAALPSKIDLSDRLSLRHGYFQSAVLGYKPYLNFDICHKAFYKECPLLNIVERFRNRYTKELDIDDMNHFFRNLKVDYVLPNDPSTRRSYRINKLMDNANKQTFGKEDGSKITVAHYFATEKKCPLRRPELPVLWVGPTQKSIYLPMEFCTITHDQVYKGFMDSYETREMVRKATSNARDRKRNTYEVYDKLNINQHPLMREFGLEVSKDMEKVPARIIEPPTLRTSRSVRVRDGTWKIQDFSQPMTLDKWCILVLDRRVNRQSVLSLQDMLKRKGNDFNMRISDPAKAPIESEATFPALKKAFSQLKDMKLVFVIISDQKGVYGKVKAICETQEGVLTQCIKGGTVGQDPRKLFTTVENILLKVNTKLGGKNHTLEKNCIPQCLKGRVMVIGADVTHPSPGMKIPSVAAVTASCDPEAFQYNTAMRIQPKGEMILDLQEIISAHLKKFYETRQSYPEKIIFFRDGVSEGELPKVLKGELAAVRNACNGFCQPKITFVVVQKRHHARFYPTCEADEQGKNFNVPVGTCVDSDIVHPRDLDFYLVSHYSILGTARPTRYRLLYDDNKLTDDEVETLAFYLCHLYARCNRSVSYPSPTYNAHLAAARVRAYLEGLNLTAGQDIDSIKKLLRDNISDISSMFYV